MANVCWNELPATRSSAAHTSADRTDSCSRTATPVVAARQSRGAVVDVAPTLLYFLGLPVARDMDGFARTDLFTQAFNEQRTITFIPTYGAQ